MPHTPKTPVHPGETAFLNDLKALGAILIPDDDETREYWFDTLLKHWAEEREHYLANLEIIDGAWIPPDYVAADLLMGGDFELNWLQVDWKDASSSMDFLDNLQRRYAFTPLQWSVADPRKELTVMEQCTEANAQLIHQGYQLWDMVRGADMYLITFLRETDVEPFLVLAERLNLEVWRFEAEDNEGHSQTEPLTITEQAAPTSTDKSLIQKIMPPEPGNPRLEALGPTLLRLGGLLLFFILMYKLNRWILS